MSKMPAKKKSCFQITSVIQAQVGACGATDDTESLDDPDESRTEGCSSEIFDMSRTEFETEMCDQSSSDEALNVSEAESGQQRQSQAVAAAPGVHPVTSCSSRFRVIKLDHGMGEPFRRGRWTCTEFYDKEPEVTVITGRTSDGVKPVNEPLSDRDSGLGASGAAPQCGQTSSDMTALDPVLSFEPGSESKAVSVQPPHTLLHAPGHSLQVSPISPQLYQNQPLSHHVQGQTNLMPSPNLEYGQHLSLPLKVTGEMGRSGPSQNLMEWAGVMSGVPLAAPSSIQVGQYSSIAMMVAQNSPTSSAGGVTVPDESRRKSDAAVSVPAKDAGKAGATEELPLVPNPGVNSLFGITIPIDGDDESASGASVVAIDNKIEQAMDLVKSHLMYAVREEVEVLKEQIKELCERNSVLEHENAVLKSLANNEQLSQLSTHTPPHTTTTTTTTTASTAAVSNPAQPSVTSA